VFANAVKSTVAVGWSHPGCNGMRGPEFPPVREPWPTSRSPSVHSPAAKSGAALFHASIGGRWGVADLNACDWETVQGVNYVETTDSDAYGDAWLVRDLRVSPKTWTKIVPRKRWSGGKWRWVTETHRAVPVTMVFVAGPNASKRPGKDRRSTIERTFNWKASADTPEGYAFFRESVGVAVEASINAAAREGADVVVLAGVSTSLYAGPHKADINKDFEALVNEILNKDIGRGIKLGQLFQKVIWPLLLVK